MELKSRYILLLSVALVSILADQATKVWARGALRSPEARRYRVTKKESKKKATIPVIKKRVEFRLSFNRGASFGMFNDSRGSARWWLVITGLLALGIVAYFMHRPEADSKLFVVGLALVAGGAVGNLIDRILFGKVTDFIVVWLYKGIRWTWPWPAFNIADAVLVVGVGLIMIEIIREGIRAQREGGDDKKAAEA